VTDLGPRFDEALVYAAAVHRDQRRTGTGTPYIAHLLHVAALVIEDGTLAGEPSEDEAIAALLHDAAEDQGGEERLADIGDRFGERVAEIVAASSDTFEDPKPPWRERKEAYIATLAVETDRGILRVSLADKVHNSRAILVDYRLLGEKLWTRFHRDADTPWYYRTLAGVFRERMPGSFLTDELRRTVAGLDREIGA
jgi:(p)ppGpp synthase/HD superfamily hydrolase